MADPPRVFLRNAPSARDVFTRAYKVGAWGKSPDPTEPFYSGDASHDPAIVDVYVQLVRAFIDHIGERPRVVDLGCGDFAVGAQVADLCQRYIACDIVEPLIERNREKFGDLTNVEFRVLDLSADDLPHGDVVFVRNVFQHLSNAQIASALPRIAARYAFLVLTEHLPAGEFVPNLDMVTGTGTRLSTGGGVVLNRPPFNLQYTQAIRLCEVNDATGVMVTDIYVLV